MNNFDKFYNKALHFLSFRPRSEKEIRDYLKKNKSDEETTLLIIEKLKDYKFLDDLEFSRRWLEQRTKINLKSKRIIELELKQKGITKEIIDEIKIKANDDKEIALKLAEKRFERFKNEPRQKQYEKMFRFLSSKGFDYDTIKQVVDRILGKEYNNK